MDPSLILVTELTATCEQCLYLKFSHTSLGRGRKGGERGGREEGVGKKKTERSRREGGREARQETGSKGGRDDREMDGRREKLTD